MASKDARLSKFEADYKQQQSEMTNKIDTVFKAITNRLAGPLPSNTVKNSKLSTSPVLSAQEREKEGDPEDTNTIANIEERRDTPLLERKDITDIEITFKTPYKDPERSELSSKGHDLLSSRVIPNKDDYDRGCRKPFDLEDGFYRDTINLGPEYATRMDDEGEVT
ncbi:hypothetical protein Tco_0714827 [Tanacetum coccineum]